MSFILNTKEEQACFLRFTRGEEAGLTFIYCSLFKPLLRHGMGIVSNEFAVESIVQEAFLKAWAFRARMTSLLHTFRFMRMNVTWSCYDYYRQPDTKLHRSFIYSDSIENYADRVNGQEDTEQPYLDEERLKVIYNVIPYLPVKQQTIFTLYFKYGLSYKQIARRFSTSNQAVGHELQKGLEHLKKVVEAKKRLDVPVATSNILKRNVPIYNERLSGEMLQLFRLRYELKLGFDVIAGKMSLSQPYVQQQYRLAHIKLQKMTQARK